MKSYCIAWRTINIFNVLRQNIMEKNMKKNTYMCIWITLLHSRIEHIINQLLLLFSGSVMSDSLGHHGQQHTRLPCPLSPGVCSNSCPLSHPTISSSVIPFSSCLQSFPTLWSFSVSQLSASGGQSMGASASASILPMSSQGWFPVGLMGSIF